MISPLRFVLTLGPRTDPARTPIVVAVAILEQATGVGLAILLGLFSEAASHHSTSKVLVLSLCLAVFVMLTQARSSPAISLGSACRRRFRTRSNTGS